jgi:tetratricopeptide (TPR) repeat protein
MNRSHHAGHHRCALLAMLIAALILVAAGCNTTHHSSRHGLFGRQGDDDFERAAGRSPTPTTLYATARLMAAQGQDDQAEALLERINAEHPTYLPAYCDRAEAQLRQRRYDDAMATLRQGLEIAPRDPVLLNNLGMVLLLKGQTQEALEQFALACEAAPRDARYLANKAMANALLGHYREAMELYELIMPRKDALHNLAVLSTIRGDAEAAAAFNSPE